MKIEDDGAGVAAGIKLDDETDNSPENKLAVLLTGITLDKPKELWAKIEADRKKIEEKYGLPPTDLIFSDPVTYYASLEALAKEKDIEIKQVAGLKERGYGAGVTEKPIKVLVPVIDFAAASEKARQFHCFKTLHEFIHGLQTINGNQGSIEEDEYESYALANFPSLVYENSLTMPNENMAAYGAMRDMFTAIKESCVFGYEQKGVAVDQIPWMNESIGG